MSNLLVPRSDVGEFRRRYKWMALFAFAAFLAVVVRLFQLQIVSGADYAAIAHENIVRKVQLATTRGVLRDAQGKILASSRQAYNVVLVPGRVMPSARPIKHTHVVALEPDTFPRIAQTLRLNPEERTQLEERIKAACTTDDDRSPCWRPILVREDLSRDIVAEIKQHQAELAGAEVVNAPVRFYPFKNLGAHLLGYIAEVSGDALAKLRPDGYDAMSLEERQKINPLGYESGETWGATGVEHAWESYLRGQRGWEKRVVDARGRYRTGPDADRLLDQPVGQQAPGSAAPERRQEPIPGRDLRLTIDAELEQSAERAMRNQVSGAVVIVDVRTGRLLALYSKPDFDPNDLSGGGGHARVREAFTKLFSDRLTPMLDRTMSGSFQPGSTFKPFSALAALEDNLVDPEERERCDGYYVKGRRIFHCTHVHGRVNMHDAISESCNVYFFKLSEIATMDRIAKIATDFGFGEKTGIGVNPESAGRIPNRSWYALRYRGQFRIGFTLNMAIGQGADSVTPLQLALAYGALANGGTLYLPQLVRAVETSDGSVVQDFPPRVRRKVNVKPENLARINEALWGVVNEPKGTAYPVRDASLDIAGKTGTAQTGYVKREGEDAKTSWYYSRDHAWFASYYPAKAPEIAVVVLVEHGGSGPTQAAPLAIQITRDYAKIMAARNGHSSAKSGASTPSAFASAVAPSPSASSSASAPPINSSSPTKDDAGL
jgi:penicillin-binding protein 2